MGANLLVDEFGLIDDPVDFLVGAREVEESHQRRLLGPIALPSRAKHRSEAFADPAADIADQGPEYRVLAIEVSVERAERQRRRAS